MKLLVEKSHLETLLRRVVGVVDKRSTIAILGSVMLTADKATLTANATDLDMEACDACPCAIDTPGATTVDATKLYDIVRNFPAGAQVLLDLTTDDPRLLVQSGRQRFRLPVLPVSEFPLVSAPDWPMTMTLAATDLARILARTSYASSNEASRFVFNSVYLYQVDGHLCAYGMDTKRMGSDRIAMDAPDGLSAIVPTKMVNAMARALADIEGDVILTASPSRIALASGSSVITSKLIDGTYTLPRIPTDGGVTVTVDGDLLASAARAALAVSGDKVPAAHLAIGGNRLVVTGRGADADALDEIEIDYDGDEMTAGINAASLAQAVAALDADILALEFRPPLKTKANGGAPVPLVIRKPGDDNVMAVIAPMVVGK